MKSGDGYSSPGPVPSGRGSEQAARPQTLCPHAEATLGPHLHRLCVSKHLCSRDHLGQVDQRPSSPLCLHPSIHHPSFPQGPSQSCGWSCTTLGPGLSDRRPPQPTTGTAGWGGWAVLEEEVEWEGVAEKGFQERGCLHGGKKTWGAEE